MRLFDTSVLYLVVNDGDAAATMRLRSACVLSALGAAAICKFIFKVSSCPNILLNGSNRASRNCLFLDTLKPKPF